MTKGAEEKTLRFAKLKEIKEMLSEVSGESKNEGQKTLLNIEKDSKDGHVLRLIYSDGTTAEITTEDNVNIDTNTTYTLSIEKDTIVLTPSNGDAQKINLPVTDVTSFATKDEVAKKADKDALADLATKAEVEAAKEAVEKEIPKTPDLSGYATKAELEDYATNKDLSDTTVKLLDKIDSLSAQLQRVTITTGGTVKLEEDLTNPERYWISGNTTIDLAGHSIDTNDKYLFVVNPGATLTLNDSTGKGHIKAVFNENEGAIKVDGGSLIINGVTIEAGSANNGGVVFVNDGGSVTVNGGNLSSASAVISGNNLQGDINITINGGTLTSKFGAAIYDPAQGHININGGTLNGGISARMGQITITDGVINATPDNIDPPTKFYNYSGNAWLPDAVYVNAGTYTSKNAELGNSLNLKITGGTINCSNGQGSAVAIYDSGKVEQKAKVTITGGTLKTNAKNRRNFQILSLADIGVTKPDAGYGQYSGNIQTDIADGIVA